MPWGSAPTSGAASSIDWRFLTPWRDALRPLLEYEDADEFDAGTLQDRLDCLVLHLEDFNDRVRRDARGETRFKRLVKIREALELIGLALHYDPLAWSEFLHPLEWDATSITNPFEYDASQLQPLFEIRLCEVTETEMDDEDFDLLCEFLVKINAEGMSDAYKEAKARIRRVVNAAALYYDEDYRVPIKFVLVPGSEGDEGEPGWCDQLRSVVWALNDRSKATGSGLQLVSIDLLCLDGWHAAWFTNLLTEIRLAHVAISDVQLTCGPGNPQVSAAALNLVASGSSDRGRVAECLLVAGFPVGVPSTSIADFVALCSAMVHTQRLEKLQIGKCVPERSVERAVCWRWLGFALHSRFSTSSISELAIYEDNLALEDAKMFDGSKTPPCSEDTDRQMRLYREPYPERVDADSIVRTVQLDPQSPTAPFNSFMWKLSAFSLPQHTDFLVLNEHLDDDDDEPSMLVLVPGFGPCEVPCESVVSASTLHVGTPTATRIERLRLHLDRMESMALPRFPSCFGSSLIRLEVILGHRVSLSDADVHALLAGCPKLQYLHLNTLNLDSMDPFTIGYKTQQCRIAVLNLWNVFVDATSMKRFAREMSDPKSEVSSQLREFRFMCEDIDKSTSACPEIITADCAALFGIAAQLPSPLAFLEVGLVRSVYNKWASKLAVYDKTEARWRWTATKLAFLSVVERRDPTPKKPKTLLRNGIPVKYRRRLGTRIFEFIRPSTDRVVNAIGVPRSEFSR